MLTLFRFVRRALIGATLGLALAANAWGPQGHEVIAALAQARLTTVAKAQVDKLLALEPGATLASISKWADKQRSPATAGWHFVNFPKGNCSYAPQRDCPDGNCVVGAIMQQLEILGSAAPPEERLTALKYVVHLVADVHQPLHAGYAEDRGGNTYQLEAFMRAMAEAAPNAEGVEVYGPADAPLGLIRGRRRKRFLVRADRGVDLSAYMAAWRARVKPPAAIRLAIDIDPYSFL